MSGAHRTVRVQMHAQILTHMRWQLQSVRLRRILNHLVDQIPSLEKFPLNIHLCRAEIVECVKNGKTKKNNSHFFSLLMVQITD